MQGNVRLAYRLLSVQTLRKAMPATKNEAIDEKHELDTDFVGVNEKNLLRKLDAKLLPALTLLYLLSFLDRSNGLFLLPILFGRKLITLIVANARIEGLVKDLHMSKCFLILSTSQS